MNRALAMMPLIGLLGLAILGAANLQREAKPSTSLSDGRQAPTQAVASLDSASDLTFADGRHDKPVIVNLFASWCAPCEQEHPFLMALGEAFPERTYGLLYKDSAANGRAFLDRLGDPFTGIGLDPDGQYGLEFGLTGVPETFVIAPDGEILLHVRGVITPQTQEQIVGLMSPAAG